MRGGMAGEVAPLAWSSSLCISSVCLSVCRSLVGLVAWWVHELYLKYSWGAEASVGHMHTISHFLLLLLLLLPCSP